MDPMTILALVAKGISVISMLVEAGKNAVPAIEAVKGLLTGAQDGTLTDEQLTAIEATLDAQIEEFNTPVSLN